MALRYSLILLAGLCLLPGPAGGEPALGADAPGAEASAAAAGEGAYAHVSEPAPLTWRVRRTRDVLDEHFGEQAFEIARGAHFALLHNTDDERAASRLALLDLTHERFHEAFGDFYTLDNAEHPLVCVLFDRQEEFTDYAEQVDRLDMSWSGGYYSSRTNRMALYDATPRDEADDIERMHGSDPAGASAGEDAAAEHVALADEADGPDASVGEAERRLLAAVDEVGAAASPPLNLASTTHEAAHQLAFNTGIQRRGVMYPFWVSEGLACAFETNHPGEAFGLGRANPTRLADLRRTMEGEGLIPLGKFVAMSRPPQRSRQRLNAIYAQAWALFQYLYLHEREALTRYLRKLANLPAGRRSSETLRAEFVTVFGPIDEVERGWHAHLDELR